MTWINIRSFLCSVMGMMSLVSVKKVEYIDSMLFFRHKWWLSHGAVDYVVSLPSSVRETWCLARRLGLIIGEHCSDYSVQ
jgi:hypothetical protein